MRNPCSISCKATVGYPVIMGDTKLARLYGGVLGLPVTYLIDAAATSPRTTWARRT